MEFNDYIKFITKSTIAETALIKRVKGVVKSVNGETVVVQINSPNPYAETQISISNKTNMTPAVDDVVWVYYWKNVADGFILPANMKGVGQFYNGNQTVEIFNDYSGTNGVTIQSGSINTLSHIIMAGVNQNINVTRNNSKISHLIMLGDTNTVNAEGSSKTIIRSYINGYNNTVSGKFSNSQIIGGTNTITNGASHSLIFGQNNAVSKVNHCYVVGFNNGIGAVGNTEPSYISVFGTGASCSGTFAANGACALGANPTLNSVTTAIAFGMSSPILDHNGMKLTTAGDLNVYGAVNANQGADYAEYEEWQDGNTDNEDRRGRFVMETGEFIRLANADDDAEDILGVVSASPTICGDAHGMNWKGRFKKDVFGGLVYKDQEFTDAEGNTKVITAEVESDDYDITREYIPRSERQEFSPIAYIGKIVMVDDGTCEADGYCKPSNNGIATKSENRTRFRVRKRIDNTHILVRIR